VGEVVVVHNGVSLYGREMKNCFVRRIVGVERIVTCVASRSHLLRLPSVFSLGFFFSTLQLSEALSDLQNLKKFFSSCYPAGYFKIPMPELNKRGGYFYQYKRDVTTNAVPQFCRDQKFRIAKDSLVNEIEIIYFLSTRYLYLYTCTG
jgi:hypothetical protein